MVRVLGDAERTGFGFPYAGKPDTAGQVLGILSHPTSKKHAISEKEAPVHEVKMKIGKGKAT